MDLTIFGVTIGGLGLALAILTILAQSPREFIEIIVDPALARRLCASAAEQAKRFNWENQARLIIRATVKT